MVEFFFITGVVDLSETATERLRDFLQQNMFLRAVKKTLVVKCLDLCVKWQREKRAWKWRDHSLS